MDGLVIWVCDYCRGSGIDGRASGDRIVRCPICKGSGYPPGYTPPTFEECMAVAFPHKLGAG